MRIQSDARRGRSLLRRLVGRASNALSRWSEINRLSAGEVDEISRDLRLATPEFIWLARKAPNSTVLLDRRLAQSGLSAKSLTAGRADALRDLQRVCGLCTVKRRCAVDRDAQEPAAYCPNAMTLRELKSVSGSPAA